MKETESVSAAVLDAVAAEEGVRSSDLTEQLFDVLDPDALDGLFTGDSGRVQFQYHGYTVTVTGENQIELLAPEEP